MKTLIIYFAAVLTANVVPLGAQVSERAQKIHDEALVFDAHVHIINRQLAQGGTIGTAYEDGQVDLPRMEAGGYDAFLFTLGTSENTTRPDSRPKRLCGLWIWP